MIMTIPEYGTTCFCGVELDRKTSGNSYLCLTDASVLALRNTTHCNLGGISIAVIAFRFFLFC